MKKNLQTISLILTISAIFSLGCGMLGGSKISNQQISDDLISKGVIEKNGSSIDLKGSTTNHCFEVKDSKFNEDTAELNLHFSADEVLPSLSVKTVIGDLNLSYKKDGEKWKLDKVNPTNFDVKTLSLEDSMSKYVPSSKPICAVYNRPYSSKK